MPKPVVAMFCTPEQGHFQPLRSLISDLARSGSAVHVFTHQRHGAEIERAGARAIDLFGRYSLEQADNESVPLPCRHVTFAAVYAERILEDLKSIRPAIIICDTFSVIGRLCANVLGIPFVNVTPAHNAAPARYIQALQVDPRVAISARCRQAVEILRERYGLHDASPFSYIDGLSPDLNICCEPPEFLTEEERQSFNPLAFYGCIPTLEDHDDRPPRHFGAAAGGLRVYACFGTIASRYFEDAIISVFQSLSECLASRPATRALISLGGARVEDRLLDRIRRSNVEVVDYVDQWAVLGEADVFLTHNGLNSTHEAIVRRVPMLSYPIFWDQPALAERCRQFGIAVPLAESLRGPVDAGDVGRALDALTSKRDLIKANLERARSWEMAVMAQRPAVLAQIMELASRG